VTAGQKVPNVHVHMIPRFAGDMRDQRGGARYEIPAKGNDVADSFHGDNTPQAATAVPDAATERTAGDALEQERPRLSLTKGPDRLALPRLAEQLPGRLGCGKGLEFGQGFAGHG